MESIMEIELTKREKEIAWLITEFGLTNTEIAIRLGISVSTVECTITKIYRETKIKCNRRYRRFELLKGVKNGDIILIDKPSS